MFDLLEDSEEVCRQLTSIDVDQALHTLKMNQNESTTKCDCCRLLRTNPQSGLFLPLARRGRPYFSTRPHRVLCSNCMKIKREQKTNILQNHIYQTIINFDLSSEEQIALNNHQYQTPKMLVWKMNNSNENTIDLSYDTNSLNENEKKILLDETIKKLQIILNKRSITTDENNLESTYQTIQTTINILSSSLYNSI